MYYTLYRWGGVLLDADKQKVVWIDGLSINPKQLSKLYEPVGICIIVNGNKALVRYREEKKFKWSAGERWELPNSSIMTDGVEHSLTITLNGVENTNPFVFTSASRAEFIEALNTWFLTYNTDYSAELVELDTDLPALDTRDPEDRVNYNNRIVVNARFNSNKNTINIEEIGTGVRAIGKHIKMVSGFYKNNGFTDVWQSGVNRFKYYDCFYLRGNEPSSEMKSINTALPISLAAFTNNINCKILRDNFSSYNDYLESMLVKYPCGAGGNVTEFPCGKENTYKLADCTYLDNTTSKQEILYPAANWAASISLNAPKLCKGNWWLPSFTEMVQIMRDITYGTSFWTTKPDIINIVLAKLNSFDSRWTMLSANIDMWTSTKVKWWGEPEYTSYVYMYHPYFGDMNWGQFASALKVSPITLYEF